MHLTSGQVEQSPTSNTSRWETTSQLYITPDIGPRMYHTHKKWGIPQFPRERTLGWPSWANYISELCPWMSMWSSQIRHIKEMRGGPELLELATPHLCPALRSCLAWDSWWALNSALLAASHAKHGLYGGPDSPASISKSLGHGLNACPVGQRLLPRLWPPVDMISLDTRRTTRRASIFRGGITGWRCAEFEAEYEEIRFLDIIDLVLLARSCSLVCSWRNVSIKFISLLKMRGLCTGYHDQNLVSNMLKNKGWWSSRRSCEQSQLVRPLHLLPSLLFPADFA